MKLTVLLLVVSIFSVQANGYGQNTKVTIDLDHVEMREVLETIETLTDFKFLYNNKKIDAAKLVSIKAINEPLSEVLDDLFEGTSIYYILRKKQIILKVNLSVLQAPLSKESLMGNDEVVVQKTVSGTVTDEKGAPLPGANIVERGTVNGVTADFDGNFSIKVLNEDAVLLVSYIGYATKEVSVNGRTILNVSLKESMAGLDEVVVVGYGAMKKSDITGSVASVSKDRLDLVPNRNIAQVLEGALPGVQVRQTGAGAVGEQSIIIRGRNSILASNEPLIVLDGIPYSGDLNDINVNDVASLEVLKDASAAAIYGSRGSNGVILVTTKKGVEGKTKISYQGKFGLQKAINLPDFLTPDEFFEYKTIRNSGLLTETEIQNHKLGLGTDWIDLSLRSGSSQTHNISVTGGSDKVKYYVGGNFMDVKGISVNDDFQRVSGRVNLDISITKWLDFGTRNQFTYDDREGFNLDYESVYEMNPLLSPAFDKNGNVNLFPWPEYPDNNPLEALNYIDEDYSNQIVSNNYLNITFPFIDGLSYRLNTGIIRKWYNRKTYAGDNTVLGIASSGHGYLSNNEFKNNIIENLLTYKKEFGKHRMFFTGLISYEESERYTQALTAVNFPNDEFSYYGISQASSLEAENDIQRMILLSQMLRLNYSYDNRYLLTLTGRRDGYSGFGPNTKWGIFPSIALGWNIAQESFLQESSDINLLKLRLSWGINGNQAVDPYSSITRLEERSTLSGDLSLVGYVPSVIGDKNLGWESSTTINIGVDYGLFKNRIFGTLDLYETSTSDLLLNRTISSVHGINTITQNIGEVRTRGLDLALSFIPISTPNFNWKMSGNFSTNKNEIISLYGTDMDGKQIDDLANAWFVGKPIRVNYDFKMAGVWQLDEADQAAVYDAVPGDPKREDVDNNGLIDDKDRQVIGQIDPKYMWGLSNAFQYKNFGLEVFFQGSHGSTRFNNLLRDNPAAEIRRNVMKKNWWTPSNPTNEFYRNSDDPNLVPVNIYEDASFIRLQDITLSYNFSKEVLSKLKFDKLQLFASGRNLLTITDWTGGDPELDLPASEAGIVPLQRELTLGLTLGF